MNKEILSEIIKNADVLKSDIILIDGNSIYGTDISFTYLLKTDFDNKYNVKLVYVNKDMKTFMKSLSDLEEVEVDISGTKILSYEKGYGDIKLYKNEISIFNYFYYTRIIIMIDMVIKSLTNQLLYENYNLREDFNFESLLQYKTSDGAHLYKADNRFPLFIYNNLLPINKGDSVCLHIYDIDSTKFLSKFTIIKKKKIKIETYIMYLYI